MLTSNSPPSLKPSSNVQKGDSDTYDRLFLLFSAKFLDFGFGLLRSFLIMPIACQQSASVKEVLVPYWVLVLQPATPFGLESMKG